MAHEPEWVTGDELEQEAKAQNEADEKTRLEDDEYEEERWLEDFDPDGDSLDDDE